MSMVSNFLFGVTAALQTLAALLHIFYMFKREFGEIARWSTRAAWFIHTIGLTMLILDIGHIPVRTLFEFAYFFAWIMMTNYVVVEFFRGDQSAGGFLTPVVAVVLTATVTLPRPGDHAMAQEFPMTLIFWHVGVSLLGYAFFTASFVAGALYVIQERNLRKKRWGPLYYRLPSLEVLDTWSGRFVYVGFPLMTLGMGTGLVFAHVTWETFWRSDPKVLFTVFVWLFYGGYLVVRKYGGWGGRKAAWWSIIGVVGLLINYFVINMVSKVHRFGV